MKPTCLKKPSNLLLTLKFSSKKQKELNTFLEEKENLEGEIVSLRGELQKKDISQNYENSCNIIEQIINNQNPFYDKSVLGYKKHDDDASSSIPSKNESNIEVVNE